MTSGPCSTAWAGAAFTSEGARDCAAGLVGPRLHLCVVGEPVWVTAANRYRELVDVALRDIREEPERRGVRHANGRLLYHLRLSRSRLYGETVAEPRHFLVYRASAELVTLLRVLHDAMDLPARLTDPS